MLIRIGGLTLLTDPVFSARVGVGLGFMTAGPRRLVRPAVTVAQLPPVDIVLLSHAHFDHLDRPSLARLGKTARVITADKSSDLVDDLGFASVRELKWGEVERVNQLSITAIPVKHWGARTFVDMHRGYNAYLLESPACRLLFGGDTAYHDGFGSLGRVDAAILGIGAYDPYIAAHATPEQALEMADMVGAGAIIPMHHSTFRLSHEPVGEPIERLLKAAGDGRRIAVRRVGEVWTG